MSVGERYLNKLKAAGRRQVKEARSWLGEQIQEGLSAAAPVAGALFRGDYEGLLPGPSPAERHRALLEQQSQEHTTRLRKVPKVNR